MENFSITSYQELLKPEMFLFFVGVGEQLEELIGLRWACATFKSAVKLLSLHLLGVELLALEGYVPEGFSFSHISSP